MDLQVKIDTKKLERALANLGHRPMIATMRHGLKTAARIAKRESLKEMVKEYRLPKKDFNVLTRVKGPDILARESSVTVKAQPIGIERFKPRQTRRGLTVRIFRSSGATQLPRAFKQKAKGKTHAFIRTRLIGAEHKPFVLYPSKKPRHVSKSGGELPINRLLAKPASGAVAKRAQHIADISSSEAVSAILVRVEKLLDAGKA